MITNDQIEEYLLHAGLPFEQVQEGMWIIHDDLEDIDNIVILHTPPVITFRVKVLDADNLTETNRPRFFEHLLRLNATMIAGAYGLEDNSVVIMDSLQSENLDFNEFQSALDAIALALRSDYEVLRGLLPSANRGDVEANA